MAVEGPVMASFVLIPGGWRGGWTFADAWLEVTLARMKIKAKRARYVGRPASASTAAGLMSRHLKELNAFLDEAFAA